jgi:dTDP-4-amino-4,6-dideoxygalactose transaminase
MPVHLYGQACDMDPIMDIARRHGLRVIEDVAQAMGGAYKDRKLGTIGDVAALSFFPSKNLGGFGDGGMVVTDDDEMAELARMLRTHGAKRKYANEMLGYNSRLDELQAAMLRVKLRHLDGFIDGRRKAAALYDRLLEASTVIAPPSVHDGADHVYHQYTVRVRGLPRDDVAASLAAKGVQTMTYYPVSCDALPVYGAGPLPRSSSAAAEVLSLPIGPTLDAVEIERVVGSI